ncbi:MAG: crosslink repair DNA glycosylase YcaQ family protein [Gammaproteobacteria bacterium]
MPLQYFHPAVAAWFTRQFAQATGVQEQAWPAIRRHTHTLIAAPTGSGKTLAAFLAAIDELVREGLASPLPDETRVLYVSPLKALSNDIHKNLELPLAGIRDELLMQGMADVAIRAQVRTGDTPQGERERMRRQPPHILVTTPESLYILLSSDSGRRMLATVRSVLVDEIHAVAGNKRGAHLTLSLERLAALCREHHGRAPVRIGLSATQKPIEDMAHFLTGKPVKSGATPLPRGEGQGEGVSIGNPLSVPLTPVASRKGDLFDPPVDEGHCTIIDTGHVRDRDLAIEVPGSPLEAVMANEVWTEIYDRLEQLIHEHRTTLIFVNTRRLAERAARFLAERLGEQLVTAHHGSLSREHRLDAEQRLKAGKLRALVATASLELGIDIGDIDLVCQLGSPRAIAAFLQRVGRAGHAVGAVPKGRLFPLSQDDLVECAALLDAVRRGELDRIPIPQQPLDVLAQQIVAEVASREWEERALYDTLRRAWSYRDLSPETFTAVVRMLADGFSTRRGRRGAYLHRDAVNGLLRGRRGARLVAVTNGGAIPDQFDYDVILQPEGLFIGSLNEDFAFESLPGDIFQLGNTSYRILKIEQGRVYVEDARGQPPNLPFWLGEAPGRSNELSGAVSRLRESVAAKLLDGMAATRDWLCAELPLPSAAARQLTEYLAAAQAALGVMPTQHTVVLERFFDETGDMHLVIHAPFGARVNRAWGLALRKRFCRKFNFELQAAALEDSIVLSLGPTHSFPLAEVGDYLKAATVRTVLIQALLAAPMFETRWRWNANIALAVLRNRNGKRIPAQWQRSAAQDLVAVIFPDQLACLENIAGDREVPDHPLVDQTLHDCLYEAMDIEGLERLLRGMETGEVELVARDLAAPSPLSQAILTAKPYAFLDDAPAEERRTLAVQQRRLLAPQDAAELGRLDAMAIAQARAEAWPEARTPDELHDALNVLGFLTAREGECEATVPEWPLLLQSLTGQGRATVLTTPQGERLWVAAERLAELLALFPDAALAPALPPLHESGTWKAEDALREIVRSRLEGLGPVTAQQLAAPLGVEISRVNAALAALDQEGYALQGQFTGTAQGSMTRSSTPSPEPLTPARLRPPRYALPKGRGESLLPSPIKENQPEWCERGLLARIHRYTLQQLRREIEAVSPADFMRFLLRWQHLGEARGEGPEALAAVLLQLEGYPLPAAAWEKDILPARVEMYLSHMLDGLCSAGRFTWLRLNPPKDKAGGDRRKTAPVRMTPIAILPRRDAACWHRVESTETEGREALSAAARKIMGLLRQYGASFFFDLVQSSGLLRTQVEQALAELAAWGLITSDSFAGLRALITPASHRAGYGRHSRRRKGTESLDEAGRWELLRRPPLPSEREKPRSEHIARVLLRRYGVVFRKLLERESNLPPWRELLYVYRRLEARGEVRGGRFVQGFSGEQFALPEAVATLRNTRKRPERDEYLVLSAADPLNFAGILTPGARVPALPGNRILFRDGVPVAARSGGEVEALQGLSGDEYRQARERLLGKHPVTSPAAKMAL